ncbi:triple tyrosine motif-containing protein [Clostridium algidicarnis]|uniref:Triple tyrosine motif-containing protein n=1 Tax=Clostridium algidicarnis TaxID=37659 RepID=A0ABS6C3A1_9CLOT|nr:triple tyrosine motif-containing protein [Clostridium algidicarnis]MBU3219947.1 triple tyrosine motif-containing protein [Clostridium algidicarnis]MCB2287133.1 triple tyrosine motif-containing protein [Clostridium algidicarnis]
MEINFNLSSPQRKGENIEITVDSKKENLLYKFFIGLDGIWHTLQDFSKSDTYKWIPKKDGKYVLMVQGKDKDSKKSFDYVTRADYIVGIEDEHIIKEILLDKEEYLIGDKINLSVDAYKSNLLFKYWLKINDGWELMKNYSPQDTLSFTANTPGFYDVLIECKEVNSKNNFDDFKKISFNIKNIDPVEIKDFKCVTPDIMVGEELIFKINSNSNEERMLIYKFFKIDSKGNIKCIQDYSTKNIVSYIENIKGKYKLLCFVKDMYSNREYDDRAVINYEVEPYKKIKIKELIADLSSPQLSGTEISFKTIVEGGKNLLYRFIVEGTYSEDTGYSREDSLLWKCSKDGDYVIKAMVKDISFEDEYEDIKEMEYSISKKAKNPVIIKDVSVDKKKDIIVNKPVKIKVKAEGGLELKYSFIVYLLDKEVETIEYGDCNSVNFTPMVPGEYCIEVRVKDKYSNKEYDCHWILTLNVNEYVKGNIEYVLINPKEYYMVGDTIDLEVVSENTKDTLIKYILKVDGHLIEETSFVKNKKYIFKPKCRGSYLIEIQGKSVYCEKGYDSKKQVKIKVHDALPVMNTKLFIDNTNIHINEPLVLRVENEGGIDVSYEFYIMEQGEWRKAQSYSKKDYYAFIPFVQGKYKILVLTKSNYKNCSYEDYDIFEFEAYEEMATVQSLVDYAL